MFCLISFFSSRSHAGYHISCHVSLGSPWLWHFPRLSLFSMSLTVLRNIRYFVEYPSIGIRRMFFSWLDWSYGFQRGNHGCKAPFLWPCTKKGTYVNTDLSLLTLTLITWLRQCMSGFSTAQLLVYFPFPCSPLWKKVTMSSLNLRSGELFSTSWKAQYLHRSFRVLLHGRFVSSLIYLFNHLFMSVWTHRYLFYDTSPFLRSFLES